MAEPGRALLRPAAKKAPCRERQGVFIFFAPGLESGVDSFSLHQPGQRLRQIIARGLRPVHEAGVIGCLSRDATVCTAQLDLFDDGIPPRQQINKLLDQYPAHGNYTPERFAIS